jgi:hypothetical protein
VIGSFTDSGRTTRACANKLHREDAMSASYYLRNHWYRRAPWFVAGALKFTGEKAVEGGPIPNESIVMDIRSQLR